MILIIVVIIILYFYVKLRTINFDNNATTSPHLMVKYTMLKSFDLGNASSYYALAAKSKVEELKSKILKLLGKKNHICIICSSASEANSLLLKSYNSYCSPYEHKSVLACCSVDNIENIPAGSMYSLMYVNNETGDIFDVKNAALQCKKKNILFHTDASQYFGKSTNTVSDFEHIDFITISLHKMYGPLGIGLLIIPENSNINTQIEGVQNSGLRGGTENIPAICGAICAIETTLYNRSYKNHKLTVLTNKFKNILRKYRKEVNIEDYLNCSEVEAYQKTQKNSIVFLHINGTQPGCNTVLVSFINKTSSKRFCNIEFRRLMMERGINVSIGSACNTGIQGPSHVLLAMNLPFIVRCGVIRFSFGDYNTIGELNEFESRCSDLLI